MIRKISATVFAATLLVVAAPAISASAATKVSNGVPCTRSGATTKVGTFKYQCAKNPMLKNSKLIWLSTECLATARDYVKKAAAAMTIQSTSDQSVRIIDDAIATANAQKPELQARIDSETARIATIKAKLAQATDALAISNYNQAIKARESYIKAYTTSMKTIDSKLRALESQRKAEVAKPKMFKDQLQSLKQQADVLCTKGL